MSQYKPRLNYQHYRNAVGQVWMLDSSFHGIGFFVTDQAEIVIGQFAEGELNGWYLYVNDSQYAYGNSSKSRLQGYNVVKSKQSTVFGNFKEGLLEGVSIIVHQSQNKIQVVEYQRGRQAIQVDEKPLAGASVSQLISKYFQRSHLSPRQYLSSKMQSLNRYGVFQQQIAANLSYFGFMETSKNVGLIFNGQFLQSFGQFSQMQLNGLGRFYEYEGVGFDGVFDQGEWNEDGMEFKDRKEPVSKDIIAFRKQYHLRQMEFNNCHFVTKQYINVSSINLKPPEKFSTVQDLLKTRGRRTTSFREQSPLKQKLRMYQKQIPKYLQGDQPSARPYNRTMADLSPSTTSILGHPTTPTKRESPPRQKQQQQYQQQEQDVYEFVKKMEIEELQKRDQLNQLVRNRTKTSL